MRVIIILTGLWMVAAQSQAGPLVMQAQSRKTHGTAGPLAIDVHAIGAVECRAGGPTEIVLIFDRPVQGLAGLSSDDVALSSGTVNGLSINGQTLTITLSGCADASRLNIAFPGVADAADAAARVEDVLCFGVLAGDINGDTVSNIFDMVIMRSVLNTPTVSGTLRLDVNTDGSVNIFDMVNVRNNLNKAVGGECIGPVAPGMVLIPAGEFLMGNSFDADEGASDELPRHAVHVDAFYMDRTAVTNRQYADALNWALTQGNLLSVVAGVVYKYNSTPAYAYCDTTMSSPYSRITWNGSSFGVLAGKEGHPAITVSWYGAAACANWRSTMHGLAVCYDLSLWSCNFAAAGYRLPTEAEWEKAARGGIAGRRFPWPDTDTIQHTRANYYSDAAYAYDTSATRGYHPAFDGPGDDPYTSPVAYFPAYGYGLYDMAGTVFEWCNDWYDGNYYAVSPYADPSGSPSAAYRVLRGGSWYSDAELVRCARRGSGSPAFRTNRSGFRLVHR